MTAQDCVSIIGAIAAAQVTTLGAIVALWVKLHSLESTAAQLVSTSSATAKTTE